MIDLYSDTLTKPTPDMRRFMCEAEVGDEQKGEDPTVNLLQEMVADLLGKEAAVFLPVRHHVQRDRGQGAHAAPRRGAGRPHLAPDPLRGRRPRPALGRADGLARRRARRLHLRPGTRRHAPALALRAPDAPGLGGEHQQSRRRPGVVPRPGGGREPRRARARARHPHGRGAAAQRGGGLGDARARLRRARGLALDRLQQGARRAGGRAAWPAPAPSSRRRGATSRRWAAPCGRPASSRRAASTRSATT